MKRTVYCALMSVLIGSIVGSIAVNVVNILYPDFGLDYGLAIALFTVLTWSLLSATSAVLRRS